MRALAAVGATTSAPTDAFWDAWSILPMVFYLPETSLGVGIAVIHTFDLGAPSEPNSSVLAGFIYTFEGQMIARIEPDLRVGRLSARGLLRYQHYPNLFFGPGAGADAAGERYEENTLLGGIDLGWRVFEHLSVGMSYDLRANKVLNYPRDGVLDGLAPTGLKPFVASGIGPTVTWDSRDRPRAPTSGVLAELRLTGYDHKFGSSHDGLKGSLDLRGYVSPAEGHVVAARARVELSKGDLPFQMQPKLGGSNLMRGWLDGQLRDTHAYAAQLEYRAHLFWRVGVAAFVAAGQSMPSLEDVDPTDLRFAGGLGLRVALNTAQNVNVRLDLALGSDVHVYFDVFEAF